MGRKKTSDGLGRSIIKNRFGGRSSRKEDQPISLRHTSEIDDGYDWGRLNLQSVTEQSNLDDFLATAQLAGTEFTAEKLNITFVNPRVGQGLLNVEEKAKVAKTQEEHKQFLKIPRRPRWDASTSAEELQQKERDSFLEWRRQLAELQAVEGILLTPFEKNLEFWRQLWRVIERSDVVVQIVDARNPLLFHCEDLEKYVNEVSGNKMNMILVNKADFLSEKQRQAWADYFADIELPVVFFSALQESGVVPQAESDDCDAKESSEEISQDDSESGCIDNVEGTNLNLKTDCEDTLEKETHSMMQELDGLHLMQNLPANNSKLFSRGELIDFFKIIHKQKKVQDSLTTIGLVGYPNVGKSSTINAILMHKKVSVSSTPGKTKHFQTLFVDNELCLCDCPGLVMPTFVSTKAEMVVNGILPIDQMRDHVGPINLVTSLIPRHTIEDMYGIILPNPLEGEEETRPPTAEEFLNSYGYMRGFMTQRGLPDNPRAARYILKDYVKGRLLYCHAPPNVKQEDYHQFPEHKSKGNGVPTPFQTRVTKSHKMTTQDLDRMFFKQAVAGVHIKKPSNAVGQIHQNLEGSSSAHSVQNLLDKPWKKHHNRNKREKLRRVHVHLDQ